MKAGGSFLCPTVDLGLKNFVPVAAFFVGLPSPQFTRAPIIIPAVVHEGDSIVDGGMDQANGLGISGNLAQVISSHAYE